MDEVQAIAERLARNIHAAQTDKAGAPYVEHLERVVANLLRRWSDASSDEVAAAWLHDTIEDSDWDEARLIAAGVPASATAIVRELTRPTELAYLEWVRVLADHGSLSAIRVKLADNEDNSHPGRVAAVPAGPSMVEARYRPAREMLEVALSRSEGSV